MSDITTRPFVRHLRAPSTSFVSHLSGGRERHSGAGASFWFRPLSAAISEIPIDDREQQVMVPTRTKDLQRVSISGAITYRFADPGLTIQRVDFSIDLTHGGWAEQPLERVGTMLHGATASLLMSVVADLVQVLRLDLGGLSATVASALQRDPRVGSLGIEIIGARFVALRPEPETERALQTPAREQIQQDADRATFERRARAVEREAAIGENELTNQIELARREESLIAQRGDNAARQAEDAARADAIGLRAETTRTGEEAKAAAASTRLLGEATADAERAALAAQASVSQEVLVAMALRELAENLPRVEHLVLTPDLLSGALAQLTAPRDAR